MDRLDSYYCLVNGARDSFERYLELMASIGVDAIKLRLLYADADVPDRLGAEGQRLAYEGERSMREFLSDAQNSPQMQALRADLAAGSPGEYCRNKPSCPLVHEAAANTDNPPGYRGLFGGDNLNSESD